MTARELLAREGQPMMRRSLNSHHGDQGQLLTVGATLAALRWCAWVLGGAAAAVAVRLHRSERKAGSAARRVWAFVTRDSDLASEIRAVLWFGFLAAFVAAMVLRGVS